MGELRKKLRATEEDLKKVQTENFKFMNPINHVYNRVSPIATANVANFKPPAAEPGAKPATPIKGDETADQDKPEVKPEEEVKNGGDEEETKTNGSSDAATDVATKKEPSPAKAEAK